MDALAALRAEIDKKRKEGYSSRSIEQIGRPTKRWRSKACIEEERRAAYFEQEKQTSEKQRIEREQNWLESRVDLSGRKTKDESQAASLSEGKEGRSIVENVASENEVDTMRKSEDACTPVPREEVVRRLRALKEPATLFGETDWNRFNRMRERELAREEVSQGQRNVFQKKLREMEAKDAEDDVYQYTGANMPYLEQPGEDKKTNNATETEELIEATASKEDYVHQQIRKYMRLWASEIDEMTKEQRRTNKGRSLVVTHEQTKDWLKPLFKLLRKRRLPRNILDGLKNIFEAAAEREYVRANSLYLEQLAIGNAPWPMGATMVGIHARAAREKIGEDKIAHVMNDEKTRKYIQAVKRLLTVAQRHFPTSYSKMIL